MKTHLPKFILISALVIMCTSFINTADNKIFFYKDADVKAEQDKDEIVVSVKTSKDNKVQFYMFTVEGNLIKQLNITGSKKISIPLLEKGTYMYEFFSNDERLKSGKIELK